MIVTKIEGVLERLEEVRNLISDNLRSEKNPGGLLERKEYDYLRCLDLSHHSLVTLLNQDEESLTKSYEVAIKNAQ